jgi:hypothetical protein|tara:strand:+ start:6375 stop:6821 length:447 start_codon:yes stop_codon:yes gene_type:complete
MITSGMSLGNNEPSEKIDLFQKQKFTSHAGIPMTWKIEMDAISDKEWDCLASMIMDHQKEPFSKVVGIPRGGVKLQNALKKYSEWEGKHPCLVVDDVYTTGTSFREFCTTKETMFAYKWVIFARKPVDVDSGVRALFTMPENFEHPGY